MLNVGSMNSEDLISCEYLVRTCVTASFASPTVTVTLRFILLANSYWIYLAEVRFHTDSSGCPPDTTVTSAPPETTTALTVSTAMLTHNRGDSNTAVSALNTGNPTGTGSKTTLNTMQMPTVEIEVPAQLLS